MQRNDEKGDMPKRRLTIDEEVIAFAPAYGIFGIETIKTKIGQKVGLSGMVLDNYCSFIDRVVLENRAKNYLWVIKHPISEEVYGYMLSTKGLQLSDSIQKELEKGTVYFYSKLAENKMEPAA